MVTSSPSIYKKHITIEQRQQVIYISIKKALYGCLRSALLFYKRLVNDLKSQGLLINTYDRCVDNRIIGGNQMKITWHVYDLHVSHMDKKEATKTIKWIQSVYGKDMRVSRGKKHDYLGIYIDFTFPGEVWVATISLLKTSIE